MNRLARLPALFALAAVVIVACASPAFAQPRILLAKYTNPVAYELKSMQTTRFYTRVDTANAWAELKVATPYGDKYIFKGGVPTADANFYFPLWDGKGPRGQRLPTSVAYRWTLTVSRGGQSATATGTIPVTRIYTNIAGSISEEYFDTHDRFERTVHPYFIPGWVTAYLTAKGSQSATFTPNPGRVWLHVFATDIDTPLRPGKTVRMQDGTFSYGKGTFPYPEFECNAPVDYVVTLVE